MRQEPLGLKIQTNQTKPQEVKKTYRHEGKTFQWYPSCQYGLPNVRQSMCEKHNTQKPGTSDIHQKKGTEKGEEWNIIILPRGIHNVTTSCIYLGRESISENSHS